MCGRKSYAMNGINEEQLRGEELKSQGRVITRKSRVQGDEESKRKDETHADIWIRLGCTAEFFRDELGEAFAHYAVDGHFEQHKVKSPAFRHWLLKQFFEETGKAPAR